MWNCSNYVKAILDSLCTLGTFIWMWSSQYTKVLRCTKNVYIVKHFISWLEISSSFANYFSIKMKKMRARRVTFIFNQTLAQYLLALKRVRNLCRCLIIRHWYNKTSQLHRDVRPFNFVHLQRENDFSLVSTLKVNCLLLVLNNLIYVFVQQTLLKILIIFPHKMCKHYK